MRGCAIAVTQVPGTNQCAEIASTARGRGIARPIRLHALRVRVVLDRVQRDCRARRTRPACGPTAARPSFARTSRQPDGQAGYDRACGPVRSRARRTRRPPGKARRACSSTPARCASVVSTCRRAIPTSRAPARCFATSSSSRARSVWIEHPGQRPFVADPTTVTFYNRDEPYARRPLSPEGDRCDWFAVEPAILDEVVRDLDPWIDDRPERPFRFTHGPVDARSYARQRLVFHHVATQPRPDPLFVEEEMTRRLAGSPPPRLRPASRPDRRRSAPGARGRAGGPHPRPCPRPSGREARRWRASRRWRGARRSTSAGRCGPRPAARCTPGSYGCGCTSRSRGSPSRAAT